MGVPNRAAATASAFRVMGWVRQPRVQAGPEGQARARPRVHPIHANLQCILSMTGTTARGGEASHRGAKEVAGQQRDNESPAISARTSPLTPAVSSSKKIKSCHLSKTLITSATSRDTRERERERRARYQRDGWPTPVRDTSHSTAVRDFFTTHRTGTFCSAGICRTSPHGNS